MVTVANTDYMPTTATYWPPGTNDGYAGLTFADPVEITCRWQDDNQKFVDADGNERISNSVVYPDTQLALGGWLYKGSSVAADPRAVTGASEIKSWREMPELSGDLVEYRAML